MPLIKLDAVSSTNDFLKELAQSTNPENFTVVSAESQTAGRGQMGSKWISEKGKNLTMSVLIKNPLSDITEMYNLNIVVVLSVIAALEAYKIPKLSIKWPNDIMSGNKKIGGILIENIVKSTGDIISIVGIGLNVNQTDFSALPKASSLRVETDVTFDKFELLQNITNEIITAVPKIESRMEILREDYLSKLFKKGIPMAFEKEGVKFMGIIQNVTKTGRLELLLEDDSTCSYEIKEITMLY